MIDEGIAIVTLKSDWQRRRSQEDGRSFRTFALSVPLRIPKMIDLSAPREVGTASDRLKPRVVASVVVPVVTILGEGRNPLILLPNRMRFVRRLSKRCPIRTTVVTRGCILDMSICNTNLTGEES